VKGDDYFIATFRMIAFTQSNRKNSRQLILITAEDIEGFTFCSLPSNYDFDNGIISCALYQSWFHNFLYNLEYENYFHSLNRSLLPHPRIVEHFPLFSGDVYK
jgi:hypothetical protein